MSTPNSNPVNVEKKKFNIKENTSISGGGNSKILELLKSTDGTTASECMKVTGKNGTRTRTVIRNTWRSAAPKLIPAYVTFDRGQKQYFLISPKDWKDFKESAPNFGIDAESLETHSELKQYL